jgi:hypothetical protein
MTFPCAAATIVYRHPCHCASASRPLEPGKEPEHRFDVDGKPFPWCLPEKPNPTFTRLTDQLWRVDLTLLCILRDDDGHPIFGDHDLEPFIDRSIPNAPTVPAQPIIAGKTFPWLIGDDGVTCYKRSHKILPELTLSFFANDVDTDTEVVDERHIDQDVVDNSGSMWKFSERKRALEDKAREATKDWPQSEWDTATNTFARRGVRFDMSRADDGVIVAIHPDTGERLEVIA